jgi:histidine phosphotransferase ChpT
MSMADDLDLHAAQMLISHLCHELVSPIGAINNGIELIEDAGAEGMQGEALELIADSGRMAAAKLRFYRMAYGKAGAAGDVGLGEARSIAIDLLAGDGRTTIDWPSVPAVRLAPGSVQLLLNLLLLASGCLPRGGAVAVEIASGSEFAPARIAARGINARPPEGAQEAATGQTSEITHKTAHGVLCARLARQIGQSLTIKPEDGAVTIEVRLPLDRG